MVRCNPGSVHSIRLHNSTLAIGGSVCALSPFCLRRFVSSSTWVCLLHAEVRAATTPTIRIIRLQAHRARAAALVQALEDPAQEAVAPALPAPGAERATASCHMHTRPVPAPSRATE